MSDYTRPARANADAGAARPGRVSDYTRPARANAGAGAGRPGRVSDCTRPARGMQTRGDLEEYHVREELFFALSSHRHIFEDADTDDAGTRTLDGG